MIEILKRFCSNDPTRFNMTEPWSYGEHSYATNGHFIVRVPRLPDVPEGEESWKKTAPDNLFRPFESDAWLSLADIVLPEEETSECPECNGEKTIQHDNCPDCDGHDCEWCDGTGKVSRIQPVPVGGSHFQLKYLRILKDLPGCQIAPNDSPMDYAAFRFSGGEGRIMPIKAFGEWKEAST